MGEHDHCEGHCVLQEVWVGVSEEMGKILAGYTLAELVERTRIGHPEVASRRPAPPASAAPSARQSEQPHRAPARC